MNPSHDLQGLKKKAKETFLYALSALLLGIAIGAIDAVFGFTFYYRFSFGACSCIAAVSAAGRAWDRLVIPAFQ